MKKFFRRALTALLIVAGLLTAAVVGAAVQMFDGKGEWHTSDAETEQMAKARAQQRAERDAQKKAGVYMKTFSKTVNLELAEDEITAFTNNIIEIVGDVQFDKKIIQLSNSQTTILYVATLKAKIDPDGLYSFVKHDDKDKIVERNNDLQDAIQRNDELAASLTEQYNRATTQAEKDRIRKQMNDADREFLINQKVAEADRLFLANDYDGAIKIYNEIVQIDPKNDKAYYEMARLYWQRENEDYENELRNIVKAIQIAPNNRDYYSFRDDTYVAMVENLEDNPKKALEIYNKALQFDPNGADQIYFGIGRCYIRLKDFENAFKYLDKAHQLNPNVINDFYYQDEIEPFFEESIENIKDLDDPGEAIKAYNKLLPSIPNFFAAEIHFKIGELYEELEDYENALKSFAKVIQLNPNHSEAYYIIGNIYRKDLKDYKQAIECYTKCIELKPSRMYARKLRGECWKELGDEAKYQADIMQEIDLYTKFIEKPVKRDRMIALYEARGELWKKLGDEAKAQADFAKAKELRNKK